MMYWVKGRIEKGGGHETTAVLEVMVSTIGLGGSGTPCERGEGGGEEVGARKGGGGEEEREGGGRGRRRGRREGDDYMSQLILTH